MRCLVLAFENLNDLPKDWKNFSSIDAYGQSKISKKEIADLPVKLNVYNQFFEVKNYRKPKQPYVLCFIKHPDPWGEPRNWLQAIAALGECLNGKLVCEFWFPHEIKAFDFLLKSLLGKSAQFVEAKQLDNVRDWKNFEATWEVKNTSKNMSEHYQKQKMKILQKYYNEIGKFFQDKTSLKDILKVL